MASYAFMILNIWSPDGCTVVECCGALMSLGLLEQVDFWRAGLSDHNLALLPSHFLFPDLLWWEQWHPHTSTAGTSTIPACHVGSTSQTLSKKWMFPSSETCWLVFAYAYRKLCHPPPREWLKCRLRPSKLLDSFLTNPGDYLGGRLCSSWLPMVHALFWFITTGWIHWLTQLNLKPVLKNNIQFH